jgi:pimeloyl-ACP methyl ester carboxylesterase
VPSPLDRWPGEDVKLPGDRALHVRHAEPRRPGLPPAVLVHGLGGSATNWTSMMGELRGTLDQWAPDLPGFGESPPLEGGHTVTAHAVAVASYLRTFDRPVHLVGNSMGGLVCVLVASRLPHRVRSLTLVSPAMPHLVVPTAARWLTLLALPRLGERLLATGNAAPVERQVQRSVQAIYGDPDALTDEQLQMAAAERRRRLEQPYADTVFLQSLRSIVAHFTPLPRRSAWIEAGRLAVPTLVLVGGRDKLVAHRTAARWRRRVPSARVVTLPSTGHVAMMERPGLVAGMVAEHVEAAEGATPVASRGRGTAGRE